MKMRNKRTTHHINVVGRRRFGSYTTLGRTVTLGHGYTARQRLRSWSALFALMLIVGAGLYPTVAQAHDTHPTARAVLASIGFDQRLNIQVPGDIAFRNEEGTGVTLADFFGSKPVILLLGYLQCPNLCSLERSALETSLHDLRFDAGKDFEVVIVSIDPTETPAAAAAVKEQIMADYNRPDTAGGWHLLTGDHDEIDRLADAVGFRYAYDAEQQQFAHASGLVILTPTGRVARYLYGLEFPARDLRLALVEAADNQIGSPVDQLLLFCYHYDPSTGKYSPLIMNIMRLAGLTTVVSLGALLFVQRQRELVAQPPDRDTNGEAEQQ
ncbi:MAG: SCO family protein [Caldilineaceae bacterium]